MAFDNNISTVGSDMYGTVVIDGHGHIAEDIDTMTARDNHRIDGHAFRLIAHEYHTTGIGDRRLVVIDTGTDNIGAIDGIELCKSRNDLLRHLMEHTSPEALPGSHQFGDRLGFTEHVLRLLAVIALREDIYTQFLKSNEILLIHIYRIEN